MLEEGDVIVVLGVPEAVDGCRGAPAPEMKKPAEAGKKY
jgi:hypothetical protein